VRYEGLDAALAVSGSRVFLFGKPEARPGRRMGVAVARGDDVGAARRAADAAGAAVRVVAARRTGTNPG
jgi:phosphoribosylglycinamide formyltransferase 2